MKKIENTSPSEVRSNPEIKNRFAIVKLWKELGIKNAEDECVARIKHSASQLGIDVFEILPDGRYLEDPNRVICPDDVDFVLHLHYQTPKNYDAFSIVALWNPVRFYMEWDYQRTSRNLLTHNDFLSCGSAPADGMVRRKIQDSPCHIDEFFTLYHSVHENVHPPSLGEGKLFYAGINWDVLQGKGSRHGPVLRILEETGHLKIFGPKLFMGIDVWNGFNSYQGEIPFDGFSMIHEISRAGVSLVLSSEAHKESELMSSRLFESIAAGALVIADENPFTHKHFGDSVLYVDASQSADSVAQQILVHLEWAKINKEAALLKIEKAQKIFSERFSHKSNLTRIYKHLQDRKEKIRNKILKTPATHHATLFMLLPDASEDGLRRHIKSFECQEDKGVRGKLCIDSNVSLERKKQIASSVSHSQIEVIEVSFYGAFGAREKIGQVILSLIEKRLEDEFFVFVAPNEVLMSDHISNLKKTIMADPDLVGCASTVIHNLMGREVVQVSDLINFGHVDDKAPNGLGRFMFRRSMLPKNYGTCLPFLDGRALACFYQKDRVRIHPLASIKVDLETEYPPRNWNEAYENEVLREFDPQIFKIHTGFTSRTSYGPPVCQSTVFPELQRPKIKFHQKIVREIRRIFSQGKKFLALKKDEWSAKA
jgi:hypothetical protein